MKYMVGDKLMKCPDPVGYSCVTGSDIAVYAIKEGELEKYMDGSWNYKELDPVPTIQGIGFKLNLRYDIEYKVSGSIIGTVFDRSSLNVLDNSDLLIIASNEYNKVSQMGISGIRILTLESGISIDDTSCEETYTYRARTLIPWEVI